MKPTHLASTLLVTAFFACPLYLMSRSDGAPKGSTGANFPGELSCTQSSCHDDGSANSGSGSLSITINGTPASEYIYTPGETVPVAVRLVDSAAFRIGFQLTARTGDGCEPGGSMVPGEGQVQVFSGSCGSNRVEWATHIFPKVGSDATYTTSWTAPAAGTGPVTFGVAGNGANGNGTDSGDNIYHIQVVSQPAANTGGPTPAISAGGIVLATSIPSVTVGTANSIVTAFGSEFAPEGTFAASPTLGGDGKVETIMSDTCIEVGGNRSPMFFVFPTQLNFQVSDQVGLGPADVAVIRGCGTGNESRSPVESLNIVATQPAFFLISSDPARQVIAALHGGGPAVVGPADFIPGVTTPAAPGEFISLFGTGFGVTLPASSAGEIPVISSPEAPLRPLATTNVRVLVGGIEVLSGDILYVGGSPDAAGLNQLVVKIPANAPDGDLKVELIIDGVSSPDGPFVTVMAPAP